VAGEPRYAEVAVQQILLLEKELADRKTGLWHFGRGPGGRTPCLWGRGAIFSLRGILDTLLELPPGHPSAPRLGALVRRMAKGVARAQDREGFLHQVLDEPASRAETSATSWGAAVLARAVRTGHVAPSFGRVAEKAWRAAKRRRWDGLATSICGGFTASMDRNYYFHPKWLMGSYGHFLALGGIEVLAMCGAAKRR
jgi:rhamnogalacturonyl hydrolase YesR